MLDINLFREEKGHNPEIIRESQRRRFASVEIVDEIIKLDKEWRQRQFEVENIRKEINKINKQVAQLKISGQDASEMIKKSEEIRQTSDDKGAEVREAENTLKSKLEIVGNLVHDSVPVDNDEANNALLGIADLKKGADIAGGRGFYLKGDGTPFFMRKEIMAKCAQLAQFDEELYKVTGEGDDKYLIATAEQPLCAYHINDWIHPSELPIRYAGYSSCFRKEAGSHGRDTLGIFRVHQFEKVEQFCITSPNGNDSWEMHEEMIKNSEDFYKMLNLPLSSCGYYYQSRRLEIRFGQKKSNDQTKQYVHLLNSTLSATERTICCILENYQKEDGVEVPEALRPFMGGKSFLPFKAKPVAETKGKKSKA
ncbi:hypothetical protein LWI29_038087 [Acer saccharum]|uniref:serine--tRNA ligase n=1 Tax=Acer saccharum TaxID=4024 RepID=A0AA39T988_ACESA|nr:hypothetical protein LWI29_038087 [Acer saccharum]